MPLMKLVNDPNPFYIILFYEHQKWAGAHHPQREFHFVTIAPVSPDSSSIFVTSRNSLVFLSFFFFRISTE